MKEIRNRWVPVGYGMDDMQPPQTVGTQHRQREPASVLPDYNSDNALQGGRPVYGSSRSYELQDESRKHTLHELS